MDITSTKEQWIVELSNKGWPKPVTATCVDRDDARQEVKRRRDCGVWDSVKIVHRTTTTYRAKKTAGGK